MINECEGIDIKNNPDDLVPLQSYDFFKYIFVFDHFYESLYLIEIGPENIVSGIQNIMPIIRMQYPKTFPFKTKDDIQISVTDANYMEMVKKARTHSQCGEVFQLVLSSPFKQSFTCDAFQGKRALKSINSLTYLDYTTSKIFGSSSETQLSTEQCLAEIYPKIFTYKPTGQDVLYIQATRDMTHDPKENAEYTMLVDLAHNDLSKSCHQVEVFQCKEIQYFSHVIHLVSRVRGEIKENVTPYQVFVDIFPAGTLSKATKNKALQLIQHFEPQSRLSYDGGLGKINLNEDIHHATVIGSFFVHIKPCFGRLEHELLLTPILTGNNRKYIISRRPCISLLKKHR